MELNSTKLVELDGKKVTNKCDGLYAELPEECIDKLIQGNSSRLVFHCPGFSEDITYLRDYDSTESVLLGDELAGTSWLGMSEIYDNALLGPSEFLENSDLYSILFKKFFVGNLKNYLEEFKMLPESKIEAIKNFTIWVFNKDFNGGKRNFGDVNLSPGIKYFLNILVSVEPGKILLCDYRFNSIRARVRRRALLLLRELKTNIILPEYIEIR